MQGTAPKAGHLVALDKNATRLGAGAHACSLSYLGD
jgi:hypothetical protein